MRNILTLVSVLALVFGCVHIATSAEPEYTTVTLQNQETVEVQIKTMEVYVPKQCAPRYCDSADDNCDGVLDTICPGLLYDVCTDGSIVDSYIDAALTGFCIQAQQNEEEAEDCDELVVSPSAPCEVEP